MAHGNCKQHDRPPTPLHRHHASGQMMGKPYRPSNGTEGAIFNDDWCANCQRDKCMNGSKDFDDCDEGDLCQIIADTLAYDIADPKYPKEWTYDADGYPCCTKFLSVDAEPAKERCEHTVDMFDAMQAGGG